MTPELTTAQRPDKVQARYNSHFAAESRTRAWKECRGFPMILNVQIDGASHPISVPPEILREADGMFAKMDADMDGGWQMSRQWVDQPDTTQRCQIVADRLLTALESGNSKLAVMMAGYILSRLPGINAINIDTQGDMTATEILVGQG
jgi:hypothetical protein